MTQPQAHVELAIVGHVGFAQDFTPFGSEVNFGGSGYACARGASVHSSNVGLVAAVGDDFDVAALHKLGVNLEGVKTLPSPSARFSITQHSDGSRAWTGELGVAADPHTELLPHSYLDTHHFHVGTMPLEQQATWVHTIRRVAPLATISVDMFETTAAKDPTQARELCHLVDLIFLNTVEFHLLYDKNVPPPCPMVVKVGPAGAYYRYADGTRSDQAVAPRVKAIDTTGAGELVAGVFLSLRETGMPIVQALQHWVMVASAKVAEFGVDGPHVAHAILDVKRSVAEL